MWRASGTIDAAAALRKRQPSDERDPYHLAKAIQSFLAQTKSFQYETNIRGVCRSSETVSDCLLRTGVGFCQQYATTMVMMLRSLGVPSRYVEGYLPGREIPHEPDRFEVDKSAAHAWVEVWFNDVGWIPFDPTPGDPSLVKIGQQVTDLPLGDPESIRRARTIHSGPTPRVSMRPATRCRASRRWRSAGP